MSKGKRKGNVKPHLPSLRVKPFTEKVSFSYIVYNTISIGQPFGQKPMERL